MFLLEKMVNILTLKVVKFFQILELFYLMAIKLGLTLHKMVSIFKFKAW